VQRSVRQGGVLSQYLFNLYTDVLEKNLRDARLGCKLQDVFCNVFIYANDICLIAPSLYALQALLNICVDFAAHHNITFNCLKTVCMRFAVRRREYLGKGKVSMGDTELCWVDSFRYLGYLFSSGKFPDDAELIRRATELRIRGIMLGVRFSNHNIQVKSYLFRTYCSQIYCSSIWGQYSKKAIHKVNVCYNDCVRSLFCKKRGKAFHNFVLQNPLMYYK